MRYSSLHQKMIHRYNTISVVILFVFVISQLPTSLNAIRCWQCACVDGRRCPQDAKVSMRRKNYKLSTMLQELWNHPIEMNIDISRNQSYTQ